MNQQYMLLIREDRTHPAHRDPAHVEAFYARMTAWAGGIRDAGCMRGGERLTDDPGRVLRKSSSRDRLDVLDGPFAEAREIVGGLFVIEVPSYAEAVRIASECPTLDFGGSLEIREVAAACKDISVARAGA